MNFMLIAAGTSSFCHDTAGIWGLLGYVVVILKIVIPLILIVLGMVDLGKAVVESDDKAISKAVNMLLHRFIAAVVVFFVPTIVSALFNAVANINYNDDPDLNVCMQCLTNRNGTKYSCTSPTDLVN